MAAEIVHFENPEETDFPSLDKMRREGKIVTTRFDSPLAAGELARFIQASILRSIRA
jgi:hypothetical protein